MASATWASQSCPCRSCALFGQAGEGTYGLVAGWGAGVAVYSGS